MKYIIIFLLFLGGMTTQAQSYLVKRNGDSLAGKIRIEEDLEGKEFIKIKNKDGNWSFDILQVVKLVDEDNSSFEPIFVDDTYRLGQIIKKGYLSLYRYTRRGESQKFQNEVLIKENREVLAVPSFINYKRLLSEFTRECPSVSNNISKGEYKLKELNRLIEDFNSCMLNASSANIAMNTTIDNNSNAENYLEESTVVKISELKTKIKSSTLVKNKFEALEMLEDISERLAKGQVIPNYLNNGFKENIADDSDLVLLYEEILKK